MICHTLHRQLSATCSSSWDCSLHLPDDTVSAVTVSAVTVSAVTVCTEAADAQHLQLALCVKKVLAANLEEEIQSSWEHPRL